MWLLFGIYWCPLCLRRNPVGVPWYALRRVHTVCETKAKPPARCDTRHENSLGTVGRCDTIIWLVWISITSWLSRGCFFYLPHLLWQLRWSVLERMAVYDSTKRIISWMFLRTTSTLMTILPDTSIYSVSVRSILFLFLTFLCLVCHDRSLFVNHAGGVERSRSTSSLQKRKDGIFVI